MAIPFSMRSLLAAAACSAFVLGANSALADTPVANASKPATATNSKSLPPINSAQLLYSMLLGEIAYARGDFRDALLSYTELLKRTNDPRIAQRANEIGVTSVLVNAQDKPAEAEAALKATLARQNNNRAELLDQLPAIFSRVADKDEVAHIIARLTEPYLNIAEAHMARAIAELGAHHTDASHAEAVKALQIKPDMERAALLQAQTTPPDKRPEAMEALGAFGKAHPLAFDARLAYSRWLVQQKRLPEAAQIYQQLLKEAPDNSMLSFAVVGIAAQADDLETAETQLHRLIDQGWGDADRLLLLLGEVQEERGKTTEAIQSYDAISTASQFTAAQLRKAQTLVRAGETAVAIQGLRTAIARSADNDPVLKNGLSVLLRQDGQLEAAYAVLSDVLKTDPNNQDALYDLAMLDELQGRTTLMEQRLRHLIELNPDHAHALNALGYSFADRNTQLTEAGSLLEKAIRLEPNDPAILDSMGWLRFRQGNRAEALNYLQRAYTQLKDPEVAGHLTEVLWADGQHDAARKLLQDSLKTTPNSQPLKALNSRLGS